MEIQKKGEKNEQYFYERKTGITAAGVYGPADGTVHVGEFTVQYRG